MRRRRRRIARARPAVRRPARRQDLAVGLPARRPGDPLVDDVAFQLRRGEALGLAGESGCGKTTTALALLGLLPTNLYRASGEIDARLAATGSCTIHKRTERGMQQVRWRGSRWSSRAR